MDKMQYVLYPVNVAAIVTTLITQEYLAAMWAINATIWMYLFYDSQRRQTKKRRGI